MIDEELYKIATDELNSDARKPDVWARACALASDDHDEARFLYTNLRVEEMLSKDGKQRTFSRDQARKDGVDKLDANDTQDQLADLELLDDDLNDPSQKDSAPESIRTGVTSKAEPLPIDDIIEYDANEKDAPFTSVAGNAIETNDGATFDAESLAELDALSSENANTEGALSGLTGKPVHQTSSELTSSTIDDDDDDIYAALIKKSADTARANKLSPEAERTSRLSADLERQADGMDSSEQAIESQVVEHQPAQQLQHDLAGDQPESSQVAATTPATMATSTANQRESGIVTDYADTDILDEAESHLVVDLDDKDGRSFAIFSRSGVIKAVKGGVSWPALLFTFPWLLSKAMIGTALVYAGLWVISIGGLLLTASTWLNAGDAAGLGIKLWTAAFALLAIIGLLYIPFRYGNRWVAEKLQNRGYDLKATVKASNKRNAIDQLLDSNINLD